METVVPLRYAVLAANAAGCNVMEAARALAAVRQTPVQDQVAHCRRAWGILAEDLEEAPAKELAQELSRNSLEALAIPSSLLEDVPPPQTAKGFTLTAEGLFVSFQVQQPLSIAWADVGLIAAAAIKEVATKTVKIEEGPNLGKIALNLGLSLATGMPVGFGKKKQAVEQTIESTDIRFFMDILTKGLRMRVDPRHFDFSCLKERKGYSAEANFRVLLGELTKQAPTALENRGARVIRESKPIADIGHQSLADLDRECRWLATLAALRRRQK